VTDTIPAEVHDDVETLWNYHRLDHELRPTDLGIGLGSHDIGVAIRTAELYRQGLFPLIVFTGANAPTTIDRFPRGEAVHYRERALHMGIPDEATCRKLWPEASVVCTSQPTRLDAYAANIGNIPRMINVMVGDTQRIRLHAQNGFAIQQDIPDDVQAAYERLVAAGYNKHLLPEAA
jgi:hypothetical protein